MAKVGLYSQSMGLLTDLYQLTMAYGYWKSQMEHKESVFHLFYRNIPFKGGFSIACGLENVIDFIQNFSVDESDIVYLASLEGNDGKPLFEENFLNYLAKMSFCCDIDAMPEGTVVFPYEPLVRVQGPLIQCQLLETPLLNIINFQTLVATKAARICLAADGDPTLEFGLRRAQGVDGALTASRAAYIGGCDATSNVLAGKIFGIPVKGTIAHSWVMAFENELDAFQSYAQTLPNNCVFIVDTYSTLNGIKNAIEVGQWLENQGYQFMGIRLDSGDLAYLSIQARQMLDKSGLPDAKIVVSNELDEVIIRSLKEQNARIDIWGIGTKLVTAYDQPALDGVYKLSTIREPGGRWINKIKISEQSVKVTTPGIQQVRRYYNEQENIADMIYDVNTSFNQDCVIVDPLDMTRRRKIPANTAFTDLLVPVFQQGQRVYDIPPLTHVRANVKRELCHFHQGVRRFVNPHQYPVGIESFLYELKTKLILQIREKNR
ncbi:MAG: nicotinate phosphoribosyltransferase [SAR324 cluster bacterium]|nr:nicotinate phosphoribosyltransferase [SAR324 cluster bacterium]